VHNFVVKTAHIGLRSVSNCTHAECDTNQAVWHLLVKITIRYNLVGLDVMPKGPAHGTALTVATGTNVAQ
jgi:hypothetical protein